MWLSNVLLDRAGGYAMGGDGRPYGGGGGFDVDFNILTAFIRLGRARPVGAGCPPYKKIFKKIFFLDFWGWRRLFS